MTDLECWLTWLEEHPEPTPAEVVAAAGPVLSHVHEVEGRLDLVMFSPRGELKVVTGLGQGSVAGWVVVADGAEDVAAVFVSWRPTGRSPLARWSSPRFSRPEVVRRVLSCASRAKDASGPIPLRERELGAGKGQKVRRRRLTIPHETHVRSLAAALDEMPRPWIIPAPSTVLPTSAQLDALGF